MVARRAAGAALAGRGEEYGTEEGGARDAGGGRAGGACVVALRAVGIWAGGVGFVSFVAIDSTAVLGATWTAAVDGGTGVGEVGSNVSLALTEADN